MITVKKVEKDNRGKYQLQYENINPDFIVQATPNRRMKREIQESNSVSPDLDEGQNYIDIVLNEGASTKRMTVVDDGRLSKHTKEFLFG